LKQPRQFGPIHGLACLALVISLSIVSAAAQENGEGKPILSFRELEAAGAIIGEIRINNQNIFDLDDPKENNALFRLDADVVEVTIAAQQALRFLDQSHR